MKDVFISGSLGQALILDKSAPGAPSVLLDENNNSSGIECDDAFLNSFLQSSGELKKIESFQGDIDELQKVLSDESSKWEALYHAIDAMNPQWDEEIRGESISLLNDYFTNRIADFEFVFNRLLGLPLAKTLNPSLPFEFKLSNRSKELFETLKECHRLIRYFNLVFEATIEDYQERRLLNSDTISRLKNVMVNAGYSKDFVLALHHKNRKGFESALVKASKDKAIVLCMHDPNLFFYAIESYIKDDSPELLPPPPENPDIQQEEEETVVTDPILEVIYNYQKKQHEEEGSKKQKDFNKKEQRKDKKERIYQTLEKVNKQKERIVYLLQKNKINEAKKILRQLTEYQLKTGTEEHLLMSYSDVAKKALDNYQIGFAGEILEYATHLSKSDAVIKSIRAEMMRKEGKLHEALTAYEAIIREFPQDVFAKTGKAETLRDLGRLEEALSEYKAIIKKFPQNVVSQNGKAETLRDLGRLEEALTAYEAIIKEFPQNIVAKAGKAETLRDLGRLEDALNDYKAIIKEFPQNIIAKNGKAETLRDLGRLEEALTAYEAIIKEFPQEVFAKNGKAETLRDLGRLEEALIEYKTTIKEFPQNVVAKTGCAETLRDLGRLTEAITAYEAIISEFPQDLVVKIGHLNILLISGEFDIIRNHSFQQHPENLSEWIEYHIMAMYNLTIGDYPKAIRMFEFGKKDAPWLSQKIYFRNSLAVARLRQKDYNKIISEFLEELKIEFQPKEHLLLTHAYAANGEKNQALMHLHTIENNPHPKIKTGLARLSERYSLNGFEKTGKSPEALDREIFEIEFALVL